MFVFKSMANAAAFAVCAQMALLLADWPDDALDMCEPTVLLPDGRRSLCGLRASIALHMSADWETLHSSRNPLAWAAVEVRPASPPRISVPGFGLKSPKAHTPKPSAVGSCRVPEETHTVFAGGAVVHVADIAHCAHGGQIVLSQAACEALAKVPRGTHFMDLGVHRLHSHSEPQVRVRVRVKPER